MAKENTYYHGGKRVTSSGVKTDADILVENGNTLRTRLAEIAKTFSEITSKFTSVNSTLANKFDKANIVSSTTITDASKIMSGKTASDKFASIDSKISNFSEVGMFNNAAYHNSIYRGRNLGSSVTAAQWAAIKAGTFDGLFIGDYWVINNITWYIAHFDYWWNMGNTACTSHHAVIVPGKPLYNAQMNTTNTTEGGYCATAMYTSGLNSAKTTINSVFSGHVLNHRDLLCTAATGGNTTGWDWKDSTVELMNEVMVYGSRVWGCSAGHDIGISKTQLALFRFNQPLLSAHRNWFWLRDTASGQWFANVGGNGYADCTNASISAGVLPAFAIC